MDSASDQSPAAGGPGLRSTARMLLRYKSWADNLAFESMTGLPREEIYCKRPTTFGNIVQTLNHMFVVDDIFRHHLEGRSHCYEERIRPEPRSLSILWAEVRALDRWYVDRFDSWSDADLGQSVPFKFVGGGTSVMSRFEIAVHVVNHSTYHRGFVGDMLRQIPFSWPANDLTVFLRGYRR